VAVTGGTGFIGAMIIRRLLEAGLRVKALLRPASKAASFEAPDLSWVLGSLGDEDSLRRLVEGTSAVIHCAGSVRGRAETDFAAANMDGAGNIARAARNAESCRRILQISSLAAREPGISPYAASKRRGEMILRQEATDLEWTILRPPAVYGPGDRELRPILQWLRRGMLFTPGAEKKRFSLIFVTDLAEAVLAWLQSETAGACYELHDGRPGGYDWNDVREIGETLYRRRIRQIPVPTGLLKTAAHLNNVASAVGGYQPMLTPGKVRELCHADWTCDNTLFSAATRWRPAIDLYQGLRRTLGD
jgi:nucleoside-diphosphate-sugar epimerase